MLWLENWNPKCSCCRRIKNAWRAEKRRHKIDNTNCQTQYSYTTWLRKYLPPSYLEKWHESKKYKNLDAFIVSTSFCIVCVCVCVCVHVCVWVCVCVCVFECAFVSGIVKLSDHEYGKLRPNLSNYKICEKIKFESEIQSACYPEQDTPTNFPACLFQAAPDYTRY